MNSYLFVFDDNTTLSIVTSGYLRALEILAMCMPGKKWNAINISAYGGKFAKV